jgi:hypothetical protein
MNPAHQVRISFAPVDWPHYPGIGGANARPIGRAAGALAAPGFNPARRSRMIAGCSGGEPGMKQTKLSDTIAQAIRKADRRYFFEDYTAQADAVLKALRKAGMIVVPLEPTAEIIEAGKNSLKYGTQRPADMLKSLYQAMIGAAK